MIRVLGALLLGAVVIGQGLWILAVQPDPPANAKIATRKSRQLIAIGMVIIGVFMIALFTAQIPSE